MEAKDWLGKRALVTLGKNVAVREACFLEMSPSQIYIKIDHRNDERAQWLCVDDVHIVEFLPDVEG